MALGVVLAAHGYPEAPRKGDIIRGLPSVASMADPSDEQADHHVFHAGTTEQDGHVTVNGGRVLCVTALGDSIRTTRKCAYEVVDSISFDGMQYRSDIGHRALQLR
jgi:phosphoribosylamine--glycine ligase